MDAASSILESPLLKVSRPVAACSRCRTAKIKCDGKLPACSACERAGKNSTCSGATDEFAKGKERSYVSALESQCERLQKKVDEARRRQQQQQQQWNEGISENVAPARDSSRVTLWTQSDTGRKGYRKEASDIDDLVGDFGFLSVNATSRDFYGITSSASFAGLLLTISVAEPLPLTGTMIQLPDHPKAVRLIKYYFDNIYMLMPCLSETQFWASVDAIYQDGGRFASSFDHWCLRMVLAISTAMISQRCGDDGYEAAVSHVCAALRCANEVLHPGSLAGIQAILLLAQYSIYSPKYFRTWYLIGMAARVAVDLGIHQEQLSEANADRAVLDLRRRTFYCLYSLDRYVSTGLDRAFSFSDDSVNVPFPVGSVSSRATSGEDMFLKSIEPAIQLFTIRHHQSTYYQHKFFNGQNISNPQPLISENCAVTADWVKKACEQVPTHLVGIYHIESIYTLILALSPPRRNPSITPSNRRLLFHACVEYINLLYQKINAPDTPSLITYIDIERAYAVGNKLADIIRCYNKEILSDAGTQAQPEYTPSPGRSEETHFPPISSLFKTSQHFSREGVLESLGNASSILEYAWKRWDVRTLYDSFQQSSSSIRSILSHQYNNRFNSASNPLQPIY